jgi:hypothetical protein
LWILIDGYDFPSGETLTLNVLDRLTTRGEATEPGRMTDRVVQTRLERLSFSGKEDDYPMFQEQFEARMYSLKLQAVLLDTVTLPAETHNDYAAAKTKLDDDRNHLWCELVQTLDRQTLMLVRRHKGNGTAAWKEIAAQYKSTERPRVQMLLAKLTGLKMDSTERVKDYLLRAEELKLNLEEVNEGVTEGMMVSIVLSGLPQRFKQFVIVCNHGDKVRTFNDLKRDLINFESTEHTQGARTGAGPAMHDDGNALQARNMKNVKCYGCGKLGTHNECAGHREAV